MSSIESILYDAANNEKEYSLVTHVGPIPPSIVKAVAKVMLKAKSIAKDAHNKHGNYDYSSVDAIYDGIQTFMAEEGLICIALEKRHDKVDEKHIQVAYEFILATETDTWTHPDCKRTVTLLWLGPQTSQAAQSYCEKSFFKSLFKLKTGDAEQEGVSAVDVDGKPTKGRKEKPAVDPSISAANRSDVLKDLNLRWPEGTKYMSKDETDDFVEKWGAEINALTEADKSAIRDAMKLRKPPRFTRRPDNERD